MAIPLSRITGAIYTPSGERAAFASIEIRLSRAGTVDDGGVPRLISAFPMRANADADGEIDVGLVPNSEISPEGTEYLATIRARDGEAWLERWTVPNLPEVELGDLGV